MTDRARITEPEPVVEPRVGTPTARAAAASGLGSGTLTASGILALQRAAGNAVVGRALAQRGPRTLARDKKPLWSIPTKKASAEDLSSELDIALRSAPENFADSGIWVHLVVSGGRLHLYDHELKPLGTWRLNANARIPGDGYYLSAFAQDPTVKAPVWRWYSFRLAVAELTDDDIWFPQGFGTRKDKGDLMIDDWLAPADREAFAKAAGTEMPTRIGMVVAGYGMQGAADKAKNQVGRIREKIAKAKTGPKGDGQKDAAAKKLPDSVSTVEDKNGVHVRMMVDGARQDIEYRNGESDDKLQKRIEDATKKVREEIDPSKSVRVGPPPPEGAKAGQISQKAGPGGVQVPEGFPVTPEGRVPNEVAYPAKLISHGPDSQKPSDLTVNGATLDYTMELDYAAMSYGMQDEVFNRLQPIAFKWELIDITNLDVVAMKAKMKQAGEKTDSGITQDLERKLSNTWEDTVNDVHDMAGSPAFAQYMGLVAISDLVQVGGALISAFFAVLSQPLDGRSIGFNREGTFILRCFAQPVITNYALEKEAAGEWKLLIRAPSVAVRGVQVMPINKRAQQANDLELTTIDTLRKQLEDVPLMFTRDEIQKTLDEAVAGLEDNTIQQIERQIRHTDEELGRIKSWHDADASKKGLDERDDSLRLWRARLDLNGIELGPYEAQLRDTKPKLEQTLKRARGFGLKGIPDRAFGPRVTFTSEIDGNTYPILANLGETAQSKAGRRIWRLVDITSGDTQDYYEGEGATHNEAIQKAFYKFRDNAGYGRGALAIRLPVAQLKTYTGEDVTVEPLMRMRPGLDARAYGRLQDLATAAELAALVVSGPAGMAIGLAGAVAGGVVAAHNLAARAHGDRLKWDFQTAMDVVGVVGAVVAVGGAVAQGAKALGEAGAQAAKAQKLGTTEKAMEALAKRAMQVGDALHIAGSGLMKGQWIILPIATYHEFEQIAEEEERDPSPSAAKYKAKRLEALARAMKGGLVQVRMMQMASDPSAGWDPFKQTPAAVRTPPVVDVPVEGRPPSGTGEPVRPPPGPAVGAGTGGGVVDVPPAPPRKPARPGGSGDGSIWAPDRPHAVAPDTFGSRVTEALGGKHETPRSGGVRLVEDSVLHDALWFKANKGKPMPEDTVAVFDPDTGHLYVSKKSFLDSPELQQQAYDGVMRQMSSRGRAALSEPVARAIGEIVLQGAIDGMPPVDAVAPPARALQRRLAQVLGPDVLNRVAFGGEVNTLRAKLAEAYGSARGNALEAALAKGDWRSAARLAGEPNAAMSNAFGELMANSTADLLARQQGGRPRDPARAALADRVAKLVGQDVLEGAFFRGRTEDLRIALEQALGADGVAKLVESMRNGDVKAAAKVLGTEHAPAAPVEEPRAAVTPPAEHAPPAPQPKAVAPLGAKALELRTALEKGASGAALHEAALDAIAETGSFKELRRQIDKGSYGEAGEKARATLDAARRKVVDDVLAEIFKVIKARHPGLELKAFELGTPGFASDRDVTLKAAGGTPNQMTAASVEAVRAAYDILNGTLAAADDPFTAAREKLGGRKLPPDRVLDSNFYTELHEGAVAPRNAAERLGIVEDQSVVSLAEVRANMHDSGEWQGYRKKLLDSFADEAVDPRGTEAQLNRLAVDRLTRQLDAAEQLYGELHPAGRSSEQMLAEVQQQLLDAIDTGASPRELRQLQAKIKLLEPDAYGTRAAVVGVVDQYQGAARAKTRRDAWEALGKGKEPLTTREAAATSAQEAAASAGKLRHAAPDSGATPSQCVSAAKYLARIWEAFRNAGLTMEHPLLDRTGEIIGSKQEVDNVRAATSELRGWAQDHNMQGLGDQQIRDAFVKQVKALGETLDLRLRRNEAIQAGMDPTASELAAAAKGPPKPPPNDPPKRPGGGGSGTPSPPPAPASYRGFATADEVHRAVVEAVRPLERSMEPDKLPDHYQSAVDILANPKPGVAPSPVNRKLSKLLPIVEAGLRNPELYGRVLAEAWERAVLNGTDINAALVEMSREGGQGVKKIQKKAGTLPSDVFFDEHVTNPKRIVDKGVGDEHGVYTHLLQDLVVDRALRAAGRSETGSEFRQLLARAEGRNPNNIGVGDLIWRVTYDAESPGHINDPETLRGALQQVGLR